MADDKDQKDQNKTPERNPGTPDPGAFNSADVQVAEKAGLTEGQVKQLRHEAGLNQLAGNEANTLAWAATPAGEEYRKGEKERQKRFKEEAEAYEKSRKKDGLSEASVRYREAVEKATK